MAESQIQSLPNMTLGETIWIDVDFSDRLASGATISSAAIVLAVHYGVDPDVATMLQGSAAVSGNIVKQLVADGVAETRYLATFTATCSDGTILIKERLMEVVLIETS